MSWVGGEGAEFAAESWGHVIACGDRLESGAAIRTGVARRWMSLGGRKSRERLGEIEWL